MAFKNTLSIGLRMGSVRLVGRRTPICRYNARPFSSLLSPVHPTVRNSTLRLLVATRGISNDSTSSIPSTSELTDPAVSSNALSSTSDLATTAGSAIAPLQHGDMASLGLTGWTPAGIIRWSFELINVTTHLPWFHTIVLGCAFWKLVTLPLNVIGLRNSMRMLPIQAEVQKIQGVVAEARKTGDIALMQKQSAAMKELYAKAGVSGFGMMAPLLQLPVTLGLFFGVRKMCELPLAQLAWSGFEYLPNLTEPSWAIAAIFTAAVNLQIHIGKYELNLRDRPSSGHLMNLIHAMSTMGFFVAGFWPSGLVLALTTTSLFTSIQSLLLRIPAVRRLFAIPSLTKEERGRPPTPFESIKYAKDMLEDTKRLNGL